MTFETALRTRLKNDATVNTLTGGRIYWRKRPQTSAYPSIVLTPFYGSRDKHMGGVIGTQRRVVQVSVFATSDTDAFAIRDAAILALEEPATVSGFEFQGGTAEMRQGRVNDTGTPIVSQEIFDIELWFNEGN